MSVYLSTIARRIDAKPDGDFPWSVPTLASFERLEFTAPVTFLIGENGSGKSTLLEAIAVATRAIAIGSSDVSEDSTLLGARRLAAAFTMTQRGRPNTRMFFRAEDAFGFTRRIEGTMRDIDAEADALLGTGGAGGASPAARKRAAGLVRGQRHALVSRYGADPHAQSHGETFLQILRQRLVAGGLYLLDEPETPFSPTRIMALIALIADAVRANSQFIIATHSPILAAFPNAQILSFEDGRIDTVAYDALAHVRVTREFLASPERYLRHLLAEE